MKDHEWKFVEPWPWTKVIFADGSSHTNEELVMKRRVNGIDEWRNPTEEEKLEWLKTKAW